MTECPYVYTCISHFIFPKNIGRDETIFSKKIHDQRIYFVVFASSTMPPGTIVCSDWLIFVVEIFLSIRWMIELLSVHGKIISYLTFGMTGSPKWLSLLDIF